MATMDSKERFSSRAQNYSRFRPTYPAEAIDYIAKETHISKQAQIADLGSGTGKFTRLLLERGFNVTGVEPNDKMRAVAEAELTEFAGFKSSSKSAEQTGLLSCSVDLITVAQAFHWFDRSVCNAEFKRVLKPNGYVCLIWNRAESTSDFMREYQDIITLLPGEQSQESRVKITADDFLDFFDGNYKTKTFHWHQSFDFDSLWGRTQSSSYSPSVGHPNHEPLKQALKELFERYNHDGSVQFLYKTEVTIGQLKGGE